MTTTFQSAPETVSVDDARDHFDDLLAYAATGRGRRVVIERGGRPVAALISFADLERFDALIRQREKDFAILDEFGRAFDDVSEEELEREINRAVAEARAELRARRQQEAATTR